LAIGALIKSSELDPNNLDTLLDLSCSYTNNLSRFGGLNNLKKWIQNHPLYGSKYDENEQIDIKTLEKDVLNLFLSALKKDSKDVSLYTALGVLYNITNDYDSAEKSFISALELNPDSFGLWNKLGATRANNKKPEDAIEAYGKALKIKPNYVRSWVNLGIAYNNMKKYKEAAKYYLRALTLAPNGKCNHVWEYLGMTFYCLKRNDLTEKCRFKDVSAFENWDKEE